MKLLIAVAVIAAGAVMDGSPEYQVDQTFEADDAMAEKLIADGFAKVFQPVPKGKQVKARLLVDSELGLVNDVIALPAEEAQNLQNRGLVDASPEAVAYATGLDQVGKRQRALEDSQK